MQNVGEWIKPPFLDENGHWKDTTTEDKPEGDWPWVGDQFLAAVLVLNGLTKKTCWEYSVAHFTEHGIETEDGHWVWSAENIQWICRIQEPGGK